MENTGAPTALALGLLGGGFMPAEASQEDFRLLSPHIALGAQLLEKGCHSGEKLVFVPFPGSEL